MDYGDVTCKNNKATKTRIYDLPKLRHEPETSSVIPHQERTLLDYVDIFPRRLFPGDKFILPELQDHTIMKLFIIQTFKNLMISIAK